MFKALETEILTSRIREPKTKTALIDMLMNFKSRPAWIV